MKHARRLVAGFCLVFVGVALGGCEALVDEIAQQVPKGPPPGQGGAAVPPPSSGAPGSPAQTCFGAATASAATPGGPAPSPAQCRSAGVLKQEAFDACTAQKFTLTDLQLSQPCGGDLYAGMQYTCCAPSPPPVPPLPPEPPVPPGPPVMPPPSTPGGSCRKTSEGDATSCKDTATWKGYAADACRAAGMQLVDYQTRVPCGTDAFRFVDFACCTP